MTPVYFGFAIKGVGAADLRAGLAEYGPAPGAMLGFRDIKDVLKEKAAA